MQPLGQGPRMERGPQNGQEPRRDQGVVEAKEQLARAVRVVQVSEALSDKSREVVVTATRVFQHTKVQIERFCSYPGITRTLLPRSLATYQAHGLQIISSVLGISESNELQAESEPRHIPLHASVFESRF